MPRHLPGPPPRDRARLALAALVADTGVPMHTFTAIGNRAGLKKTTAFMAVAALVKSGELVEVSCPTCGCAPLYKLAALS